MDRTSIIVVIVCFALIMLWSFVLMPKLYPVKPLPPGTTNALAASGSATNEVVSAPVQPPSLEAMPATPTLTANTNVPEDLVEITNENARYTFTSRGGGLKLIELLQYPETVSTRREHQQETNRVATLNAFTPAPTLALLGGDAIQGDGIFKLTKTGNGNGVRAEKILSNGLTIVKDFELSTNYLVSANVRLENHSDKPLNLPSQEWVVGTATPMGARDNGQAVGVLWYNGSKGQDVNAIYFSTNTTAFFFFPRTPKTEFRGGASNVVWVAAHNQFFALAVMPQQPAESVVSRRVYLPRLTGEEAMLVSTNAPLPEGLPAALVYPASTLMPNQVQDRQVYLFAGPKEYRTLARIAVRFGNNVDLAMGFDRALGGRFTAFFAKMLLLSMNALHDLFKVSYGWVIIIITVLIKLVFWPLTQASTRSMKRMQALQPQMKAMQEKYKDEPQKLSQKQLEFWKKNKVNPMGGCLPMVLQIPVFFGFYRMIQSAIELRGAPFLWVGDLSQSDTLFVISGMGFVPFIGIPGVGLPFNLLPLIMGATMLWQARLTPPSPGMDPTQAKIMRYMPLMFMVFLYRYSAGLTLYWTVQNLLTIVQTKLTKTIAEATPAAKVPVLTPPQKK